MQLSSPLENIDLYLCMWVILLFNVHQRSFHLRQRVSAYLIFYTCQMLQNTNMTKLLLWESEVSTALWMSIFHWLAAICLVYRYPKYQIIMLAWQDQHECLFLQTWFGPLPLRCFELKYPALLVHNTTSSSKMTPTQELGPDSKSPNVWLCFHLVSEQLRLGMFFLSDQRDLILY